MMSTALLLSHNGHVDWVRNKTVLNHWDLEPVCYCILPKPILTDIIHTWEYVRSSITSFLDNITRNNSTMSQAWALGKNIPVSESCGLGKLLYFSELSFLIFKFLHNTYLNWLLKRLEITYRKGLAPSLIYRHFRNRSLYRYVSKLLLSSQHLLSVPLSCSKLLLSLSNHVIPMRPPITVACVLAERTSMQPSPHQSSSPFTVMGQRATHLPGHVTQAGPIRTLPWDLQ